ncbi:MAG: hypothetical protein PVJ43_03005 [Gemmatimonadales bacterium]|jgi:hypothetical protein
MRIVGRWWLSVAVVLAGLCLAGLSPEASAQEVVFQGRGRGLPRADDALRRVLQRGNYRLLDRDTLIGADDIIRSDVLVIGAAVRLEGRIEGDLIGVQSDVFARPGARLEGTVAILGGGFYGSSLAELDAPPIDAAVYAYTVRRRDDGVYVITAPGSKARVVLPGLYGFLLPTYDRVNALTIAWGIDFERGASRWLPDARARARYRSVRTDLDGDIELRWPIARHAVALRGGLTVRTNDSWINGDLENSLYAIIGGIDTRNYYEASFAEAALDLEFGSQTLWRTGVTAGWERAESLANRDPFSIFTVRDGFQANAPVREADALSAKLSAGLETWIAGEAALKLDVEAERADADLGGDLTFTVLGGSLGADIPTIGAQSLIIRARGQIPGSEGAPGQRWRALGGWGSLPTLRPVERQGDTMWWAAATYRLPLRPEAGLFGRVDVWVQYAAGNAWIDNEERPPAVHNLGLGATLGPLAGAIYADPSDDFRSVFALGIDTDR